MRKIFLMVAAAAAMLATSFTACKTNPPEPPELPNNIDIYVAGTDESGSEDAAKVWKNGKELYALTDGSKDAAANSVFVVGGDVYTAGGESNGKNYVAKVWKNGKELYSLTDKGEVYSIFIVERK